MTLLYFGLALALVGADQWLKVWVRGNIPLGGSLPFIPHIMELTYTRNTGAAFSSFSGMTWLLTAVSLVVSVVLAVMLWKRYFPGWLGKLSLTLLLAGAVGNLIDRLFLGFVTDMFATTFINFAVFNIADICVCCGGALMVVYVLLFWDEEKGGFRDAG